MKVLAQPLGYKAMLRFLSKRSAESREIERLLRELALDENGRPTQEVLEEWNSAVQDAMTGNDAGPITRLGL